MRIIICLFLIASCGEPVIGKVDKQIIDLGSLEYKPEARIDSRIDSRVDLKIDSFKTVKLLNTITVCQTCTKELLEAKTIGINKAMVVLYELLSYDVPVSIVFHLDGDDTYGKYETGMTGYAFTNKYGSDICLYDVEKENRSTEFNPINAVTIQDQLLVIHETMHVWFYERVNNYNIEEPFCKLTSFLLSETLDCSWFGPNFSYPDKLMYDLCGLGMDIEKLKQILRLIGNSKKISSADFSKICSSVLGKDTTSCFKNAGLF